MELQEESDGAFHPPGFYSIRFLCAFALCLIEPLDLGLVRVS